MVYSSFSESYVLPDEDAPFSESEQEPVGRQQGKNGQNFKENVDALHPIHNVHVNASHLDTRHYKRKDD